jgi:hypothetical protein
MRTRAAIVQHRSFYEFGCMPHRSNGILPKVISGHKRTDAALSPLYSVRPDGA